MRKWENNMLSYKNWKSLNESILSRSLGISSPQSLGLVSPIHTEAEKNKKVIEDETGDGEVVPASSKKDEPSMMKCKHCGKYSKMMKKEEMEYEEEGHDEEGHDEEGHDEEGHDEEDHDEEGHDEEGHDEEDHDEEDHDEEDFEEAKGHKKDKKHMKHMKCMKCMQESVSHKKKKTKKGKKNMKHMKCMKCMKHMKKMKSHDVEERDINKNGKIEPWEKARAKAIKKNLEKNESVNSDSWMKDVFGINPQQKFFDGLN